ncbi:site-specific integrase [Pontibacter sp. H259]|uniref:site-specific integrase n=1 Tax=Pontibacter sp. H259 TaxID=3133421 RepID=UPI0030C618CA
MFRYSTNSITVCVILDTRRQTKDGLYPVKVRVIYERKIAYYATGKRLSPEDWEKMDDTRSRRLLEVKDEIQEAFDRVQAVVKELVKNDAFTLETLNIRLKAATGDTVNTAFQATVDALAARGKVNTADWYKYALRSVTGFAGGNIRFSQVTVEFLQRYEQHMLQEKQKYTTISMYMRALQAIINKAKTAGIVKPSHYPFGKGRYEIPQPEVRHMALTVEEIDKIMRYACESDTTEMCRDLWLFSYLCNGANITDVCKLKFSNIRQNDICFYRQKTIARAKRMKLVQAVLTAEMKTIIGRWGNTSWSPDDYIFPFLQGGETPVAERRIIKNITHLINDKMKVIAAKVGLGHISTYTARHSYATVLKRAGVSIAYISEGLGHAHVKMTETYLANFEQEERIKNAALLTHVPKKAKRKISEY